MRKPPLICMLAVASQAAWAQTPAQMMPTLIGACNQVIGVAGPFASAEGLPWSLFPAADGSLWRIDYAPGASGACQSAAQAALAAFNIVGVKNQQTAQAQYAAALAAGLSVTWQTSTALDGTYALTADPITGQSIQTETLAELSWIGAHGTFINGQTTRGWPLANGSYSTFTIAQWTALASAEIAYMDALAAAEAVAAQGGTASWPSASVTINE